MEPPLAELVVPWEFGISLKMKSPRVGRSCLRAEQAPGEGDVALPQWDPQPSQTPSSLAGGFADAAC